MRSSGSTPSRSLERPLQLHLWLAGEDHPKACTGRRLLRAGLVQEIKGRSTPPRGLLLDPHATAVLSPADRGAVEEGLTAVDCSWNRLGSRGQYPSGPLDRVRPERRRRLPWLLAGNPQHYGRLGELNTVEALAAALVILRHPEQATRLLERTGSGRSFLDLNARLLDRYSMAGSADEVRSAEADLFGG